MHVKLIAKTQKNSQEEYRFSLQEYQGCKPLDIRVYCDVGVDLIPTKKGISVPLERLEEFMNCLEMTAKKGSSSHVA